MSVKLPAVVALIIGITTVYGNGGLASCIAEPGTGSLTCNISACNLICLAGKPRKGGIADDGQIPRGPGGGDDEGISSSGGDDEDPNNRQPTTKSNPEEPGKPNDPPSSQGSDQFCKTLCAATIKRAADSTATLIIGITVGALVRCPTSALACT